MESQNKPNQQLKNGNLNNSSNSLNNGEKIDAIEALQKEKREEEKKGQKPKQKKRNLVQEISYYGVPIFSILFFVGIMVYGTIPSIQGIFDKMSEVGEKKLEIEDLDSQIKTLKKLKENEAQIDRDLTTINNIVPSRKTQVAKFVGEIEKLAKDNNLEESEYKAGETIDKLGEEESSEVSADDNPAIIQIPTSSEYVAEFSDIKSFLNTLYKKKDFIIVSSLEMRSHEAREYFASLRRKRGLETEDYGNISKKSWTMSVTFKKYQFSNDFYQYIQDNFVSIKSQTESPTLKFIRERFAE